MKKIYIAPIIKVTPMKSRSSLLAGSVTSNGLDDFEGFGGTKSNGSADSRDFYFEELEEY